MKSKTARAALTFAATVAASLAATLPDETTRIVLGAIVVGFAAVGIVPAHLDKE